MAQGLLIDYEYCTGCRACEVACKQEYNHPPGVGGMKVMEILQQLPKEKMYLSYVPFPTEMCILCAPRMKLGKPPACVKHCMADCIRYGAVEELSKEAEKKARMVLWVPRVVKRPSKSRTRKE